MIAYNLILCVMLASLMQTNADVLNVALIIISCKSLCWFHLGYVNRNCNSGLFLLCVVSLKISPLICFRFKRLQMQTWCGRWVKLSSKPQLNTRSKVPPFCKMLSIYQPLAASNCRLCKLKISLTWFVYFANFLTYL